MFFWTFNFFDLRVFIHKAIFFLGEGVLEGDISAIVIDTEYFLDSFWVVS